MNGLNNNYHECKLQVKAIVPGTLSSFVYAYCKTVGCPAHLERYFIRKAISFVKLSRYVHQNITNDFDCWYRKHQDSETLFAVIAEIINKEENRTLIYGSKPKMVSKPFKFDGCELEFVLVPVAKSA